MYISILKLLIIAEYANGVSSCPTITNEWQQIAKRLLLFNLLLGNILFWIILTPKLTLGICEASQISSVSLGVEIIRNAVSVVNNLKSRDWYAKRRSYRRI